MQQFKIPTVQGKCLQQRLYIGLTEMFFVVLCMDGHCDICKDQLSNGFISFKRFEEETFAKLRVAAAVSAEDVGLWLMYWHNMD